MTLFNFLKREPEIPNNSLVPPMQTELKNDVSTDTDSVKTHEEETSAVTSLLVTYASGWPIDIIYGHLLKNYEEKGYEDAMLNSNLAFRDMNMSIIRKRMLMIFREVNLRYDGMKRELETRINTCSAAGLLTSVAELEKKMGVIRAHKEELAMLENDFRNNANEASVPLMSSECGFLRGVSAIAMSEPTNSHPSFSDAPASSLFPGRRVTA